MADIRYLVKYPSDFETRAVEKGGDVLSNVRVIIDGEYVIGSEDSYIREWIGAQLLREIRGAIDVLRGETVLVTYTLSEHYLILAPRRGGDIELIGTWVLSSFEPPVPKPEYVSWRATVPWVHWAEAISEATSDYLERIRAVDEALLDRPIEWLLAKKLEHLDDKIRKRRRD